ncbi:hypothetical protein [Alicyclobacillus sp. SO9]|uniref:hypothetical protein n=1 Tax=Alicyclobacillus sp. SO9 TaxID=2665646 RepID=UPI0018E7F99C|nr:hypothetical protein [Alicyclobacillus sp. SO9]QQE80938.1 hypothetical protein GI364_11435 [Alicyclobacillus sp. SO9]
MTMQFLSATAHATGIQYSVWLDTNKTDSNGNPNPAYVRNYTWAPNNQAQTNLTDAEYQTMTENEVKLLAQSDLAQLEPQTQTNLSVSGSTF